MKLTREEMNRIMKGEGNKPSPFSGFGNTDNKPSPFQDPYGFSAVNKQIENLPRFSVSKEDYENFADYDVYLNAYTTREEAEKQRAKNQSWIEQTGRAVTQAVANEFILGTLSGFSNMYDSVYNLIVNDGYNDYTNAVSTALEKLKILLENDLLYIKKIQENHLILEILDGGLIMLLVLHLHYLCLFRLQVL